MDVAASIIGAGVVGLAIGARLSESMDGVFILERNDRFGQETSSRNSEVIHSGIYYPTGSLKASLCVEGNRMPLFCRTGESIIRLIHPSGRHFMKAPASFYLFLSPMIFPRIRRGFVRN